MDPRVKTLKEYFHITLNLKLSSLQHILCPETVLNVLNVFISTSRTTNRIRSIHYWKTWKRVFVHRIWSIRERERVSLPYRPTTRNASRRIYASPLATLDYALEPWNRCCCTVSVIRRCKGAAVRAAVADSPHFHLLFPLASLPWITHSSSPYRCLHVSRAMLRGTRNLNAYLVRASGIVQPSSPTCPLLPPPPPPPFERTRGW